MGSIATAAYCVELSPRDIVAQSISNYDKDWNASLEFNCIERDVTEDTAGTAKSVEVSQISVLDGTPYSRLIGKNGHPLTAEEARKEDEKYQKALSLRDHETAEQRDRRVRHYLHERRFLQEISDAFNLKLLGEETLSGRPNYLIELTPKPGYVPKLKYARMFADIQGKLWIDQRDLRWTKAEAEVIDTISIGWFLARIGPGTHISMKQVKVDDEHWLTEEIAISGFARIMLVKNRPLNEKVSYSDYQKIHHSGGHPSGTPAGTTAANSR